MSFFDLDPATKKCSVPHPFAGCLANGWEAVRLTDHAHSSPEYAALEFDNKHHQVFWRAKMSPDVRARERSLQIARSILDMRIGILEGVRALLPLLHSDPDFASQEDCNLFQGVASETDDLPIGKVRIEWHPDYLPEKDQEIARCEDLWRDQIRSACERILLRAQQVQ